MKFTAFIMVVLCALPAFAANKNKQKKPVKEKVEVVEDWFVYNSRIVNGFKSPRVGSCTKAAMSPGDAAKYYDNQGGEYQLVEQLSYKTKPMIVDIITGHSNTQTGAVRWSGFVRQPEG